MVSYRRYCVAATAQQAVAAKNQTCVTFFGFCTLWLIRSGSRPRTRHSVVPALSMADGFGDLPVFKRGIDQKFLNVQLAGLCPSAGLEHRGELKPIDRLIVPAIDRHNRSASSGVAR